MKLKWTARIGALAAAACLVFSAFPAFADGADTMEVIFTDVTESNLTTLAGEAKIKVSVKGAEGDASIAQIALAFTGDLKYKSIQFLQGENNPPKCFQYSPNAALVNSSRELMPSIISSSSMKFADETDLFVLTFAGESGESVSLSLGNPDSTYCTVGGKDLKAAKTDPITVTASSKANEGKKAVIRLVMDKVDDFTAGSTADGYQGSGIEVKITGEKTSGYTVYTVLNNTLVSKGGHRESESIPTFTVENTVLADDTYTVEVSGLGYVPYRKTGVTFDKPLELTNADFIPGDVNADEKVDAADKQECEKAIADSAYAADLGGAADFNRDGRVDKYDLAVFDSIGEDAKAPEKMPKPTLTGGNKKITVEWNKPADDVTGYIIKYGESSASLKSTKDVTNAAAVSTELTGLSSGTTYYVAIAAKNAAGTGEFSDTASAKTDSGESGGGTGGGGTGGGGTGGGGTGGGSVGGGTAPAAPVTPTDTGDPNEAFTDLANYAWAKDAVYTLKDKGIISGVSETEFAPANKIKRCDFILILTKMLGIDNEFSENFADVPESAYYYDAVGRAKAAGIASGDGENFMPESSITRQDLITLAYRSFLAKGYIEETEDFSVLDAFADKDSISDYAAAPMASMVSAGIIKGSDGNVNPQGSATRAEVAVMCARLLELMK